MLNDTIYVSLLKSTTEKRAFYLVFSKDLEIPSYINLDLMVDLEIENVDPAYYEFSVRKVPGHNDRLKIEVNLSVSVQNPTIKLGFSNSSKTYIHGKFNTSFQLDNFTGYNISLETFVKTTEDSTVHETKKTATLSSFEGLTSSLVLLCAVTYVMSQKRMSILWFLVDAIQLLSTLAFLEVNFSDILTSFFEQTMIYHAFFMFRAGKVFDVNSQQLTYFGHVVKEKYIENKFFKLFMSEKFLVNGTPVLFIIFLVYFFVLSLKFSMKYNEKLFKIDEDSAKWTIMQFFYRKFFIPMLLRVHIFFLYIILIAVFVQLRTPTFEDVFNSLSVILAVLTLIYFFAFFAYMAAKIINDPKIYEDVISIEMYDPLFQYLEKLSFFRRNHFIAIQIKKLFIVIMLISLTNHPKAFLIILVMVQILSSARYLKYRPFQIMAISFVNMVTEVAIVLIAIVVINIENSKLSDGSVISADTVKGIESSSEAIVMLTLAIVACYFGFYVVVFIYLFLVNIDVICYICCNMSPPEEEEKLEEENEDEMKNMSPDVSKNVSVSQKKLKEDLDQENQKLNKH